VTAIAPGSATIHATVEGVAGVATVAVTVAPVASVSVSLGWAMLELAETTAASAVLRDAVGNPLSGRVIEWSSQDTTIAVVSPGGVVTAVAAGTTRIAALSEGVFGSAQVAVFDQPPNLTLDGLYLTQAVQRWEGGVPLVAGGHPVLVSVFGTLDRPLRTGRPPPQLRLTVYHGAVEILADQRPITGSAGPAVNQLVPLHQVVLPASVAATGLRVVATVNPGGAVPEATLADNSWPRSGEPVDVAVIAMPTLELHFVPIHLSTGGSVGNVAPETMPEYLYATQQVHPVSGIDVTIGGTLTSGVAFGDGQAAAWLAILQALDLVRVSEGSTRYYVGALRPPPGVTFVQYGGYAYIPSDPASTGFGTRTAVVVGVGWFNRQRQTTELVAHELGHTMGRRHAPCGAVAGPDPDYPYPAGIIGAHGHDLYTYSLALAGLPTAFAPAGASDVMSYCLPAWISDYNYEALMAARSRAGRRSRLRRPHAPSRASVSWCGAQLRMKGELHPAFTVPTVPALRNGRDRTGSKVRRDGVRCSLHVRSGGDRPCAIGAALHLRDRSPLPSASRSRGSACGWWTDRRAGGPWPGSGRRRRPRDRAPRRERRGGPVGRRCLPGGVGARPRHRRDRGHRRDRVSDATRGGDRAGGAGLGWGQDAGDSSESDCSIARRAHRPASRTQSGTGGGTPGSRPCVRAQRSSHDGPRGPMYSSGSR
jgi:hypothetical protein